MNLLNELWFSPWDLRSSNNYFLKCIIEDLLSPGRGLFTHVAISAGEPICLYTRGPMCKVVDLTGCVADEHGDYLFFFKYLKDELWWVQQQEHGTEYCNQSYINVHVCDISKTAKSNCIQFGRVCQYLKCASWLTYLKQNLIEWCHGNGSPHYNRWLFSAI